jgi:hypothetical protein
MGNDGNMDVPHGGRSVEFLNSTGTAMEITSYSNRLKMVNRRVGNGFHSKLLNYRGENKSDVSKSTANRGITANECS